jgi:transposase
MKLHANARLSVKGRELLVDRVEVAGWSVMEAAEAAGITDRTARKWLARYRAEGDAGLLDRSSAQRGLLTVQTSGASRRSRRYGACV